MNKDELVKKVSKKLKITQKETYEVISAFIDTIVETVSNNDKVTIAGFGTFQNKARAPRIGRNPTTNQEVKIPARNVPVFTAGKDFKDKLKNNS